MSTRRIRRKGPDGKDIILDVDLGAATPYSAGRSSGVRRATLGLPVGHMQSTDPLRNRRPGGGWAVVGKVSEMVARGRDAKRRRPEGG